VITGYRKIMFNDFITAGPAADPAGIARAGCRGRLRESRGG
jgi:ABC-type tungstate transport system permease subunit